jgi:hypothetical protein
VRSLVGWYRHTDTRIILLEKFGKSLVKVNIGEERWFFHGRTKLIYKVASPMVPSLAYGSTMLRSPFSQQIGDLQCIGVYTQEEWGKENKDENECVKASLTKREGVPDSF